MTAVRLPTGRYENNRRAYDADVEAQRRQLAAVFVGAGVPATPLRWGHSGTLSLNSLAAILNQGLGYRRFAEVHPSDYDLEGR